MVTYVCYPGGLYKCLTLSYDDGKLEDRRLLEILNKNGIKSTFNLNYGIMLNEDHSKVKHPRLELSEINELYKGHEIATHTCSHPTISRLPITSVVNEIVEDRKGLEAITGKIIRGHAYPNGSYNEEIMRLLPSLGIAYARVVETTGSFNLPDNPYCWKGTCHHNDPKLMDYARSFAEFSKSQYLKLMYVWGHSYEFADNDNWDVIENFCQYIGGRDDIWYATNIEYIDYMQAANNLQFSMDGSLVHNPSAISVYLRFSSQTDIMEIKPRETLSLK